MRNGALKLYNTIYTYTLGAETFCMEAVHFKITNHFGTQDWEKIQAKKKQTTYGTRAGA